MFEFLPTKGEQVILITGGILGAIIGFIFDGACDAFYWLLICIGVDYVTGMIQAFKTKTWSSSTGCKGLFKKIIIILVTVLFHGLAKSIELPMIETAVACSFMLNELCSILENIERAGYGKLIPAPVRKVLDIVEEQQDDILDKLK